MVDRFVIDISLTNHVFGEWYINHKPIYHLLSRTRLVSDISITNLPTICYQERDWWVIYQSQKYLPFALKNVTGEWYINHKPTYHLLSRTRLVSDISIIKIPTICSQERDRWVIYQSQKYLPFALKNEIGEWYINHKPTYHLLSRTRLVNDTSITNLPAICYQKCDWWMIYQSQNYLPLSL
jgi:hypothetical protein